MSTSAQSQANIGDSEITKTSGGAHGALHGQLTQQPLGKFGHEGQIGHVGRMLFFWVASFTLLLVCTVSVPRAQHFLQLGFGSFGVSGL